MRHDEYHQYLRLEHLEKMLLDNTMLLRRGNSTQLDDWRECAEFGEPNRWARTYIGCFCHERVENVALWWMYGKGETDAVCVTLSRPVLRAWFNRLSKETSFKVPSFDILQSKVGPMKFRVSKPPFLSDVAYATIRKKVESARHVANGSSGGIQTISWDDVCRHVKDLAVFVRNAEATGRFKDYEWRFERETRVLVEIEAPDGGPDQISVPFSLADLSHAGIIRITAGPWMSDRKFDEMERRLSALFPANGGKSEAFVIERSSLTGALNFRK